MDIYRALLSLRPGAKWHLDGNDYSNIQWLELSEILGGQSQPTKEEVIAEIERLRVEYESKEYQRLREAEYPSFADQFDLLYHGGYDAWKEKINMIKSSYPKPVQEENTNQDSSPDMILENPEVLSVQEDTIIEQIVNDSSIDSNVENET
jgi:hypothetical protein